MALINKWNLVLLGFCLYVGNFHFHFHFHFHCCRVYWFEAEFRIRISTLAFSFVSNILSTFHIILAKERGRLWRVLLRKCTTSRTVAGSIADVIIELTWSFRPHYAPGFDSAFNRNEYQEYNQGRAVSRCLGLTILPPSYSDCLEVLLAPDSSKPMGSFRPLQGLV